MSLKRQPLEEKDNEKQQSLICLQLKGFLVNRRKEMIVNDSWQNLSPRVLWLRPKTLCQSTLAQDKISLPEYSVSGQKPSPRVLWLRPKSLLRSTMAQFQISPGVLWLRPISFSKRAQDKTDGTSTGKVITSLMSAQEVALTLEGWGKTKKMITLYSYSSILTVPRPNS